MSSPPAISSSMGRRRPPMAPSSRRCKGAIGGRALIAAASTHAGEEAAVIDAHQTAAREFSRPADADRAAPSRARRRRRRNRARRRAEGRVCARAANCPTRRPTSMSRTRSANSASSIGWRRSFSSAARWFGMAGRIRSSPPSSAPPSCTGRMSGISPRSMRRSIRRMAPSRSRTPTSSPPASPLCWRDPTARARVAEAARATVDRLGGALERTLQSLEPYLMQLAPAASEPTMREPAFWWRKAGLGRRPAGAGRRLSMAPSPHGGWCKARRARRRAGDLRRKFHAWRGRQDADRDGAGENAAGRRRAGRSVSAAAMAAAWPVRNAWTP